MAHESFEDQATADVLNKNFVNIKVDREERPDIDSIYMQYLLLSTGGGGGWPLSVFLSPKKLAPFYAGTYFPPNRKYGRMSFRDLLQKIEEVWEEKGGEIEEDNKNLFLDMERMLGEEDDDGFIKTGISSKLIKESQMNCLEYFTKATDPTFGGFGRQPKFPQSSNNVILHHCSISKHIPNEMKENAVNLSSDSLYHMTNGGIYDQIGGGIHRYSVTRDWLVPHFEKMLYDQAQVLTTLVECSKLEKRNGNEFRSNHFYSKAKETADYVLTCLSNKNGGGFFSAEDADSVPHDGSSTQAVEGSFYVFSYSDLEKISEGNDGDYKEHLELFCKYYGITKEGNVAREKDPHNHFLGKNILHRTENLNTNNTHVSEESLTEEDKLKIEVMKKMVMKEREKRPRPFLDDKIITAWNGLMISSLAKFSIAHRNNNNVEEMNPYVKAAVEATEFILENLYNKDEKSLFRIYCDGKRGDVNGFADDYAYFIMGLLDLYHATFDTKYLKIALDLQETQFKLFWDHAKADVGGYFNTAKDNEGQGHINLVRMKNKYDSPEPSANAVSCYNMIRIAKIFGSESWRQRSEKILDLYEKYWLKAPGQISPYLASAAYAFEAQEKDKHIVLCGDRNIPGFNELREEIERHYLPYTPIIIADRDHNQEYLAQFHDYVKSIQPVKRKAAVFLCEGFQCQLPITDPKILKEKLSE